MTRQLVFVHGRAQEGKESVGLKQKWVHAWEKGLAKSGLEIPLSDTQIRFPYYGDTLDQMVKGITAAEADRVVVRGPELVTARDEFIRQYLAQVQEHAAITAPEVTAMLDQAVAERGVLNWEWVQGLLSVLDKKVPFASSASVALFTNDVFQYINLHEIRSTMDAGVRSAFTPGVETVVVAHSLGTLVAYNVLHEDASATQLKVPLFITLGSPLAVKVIKKSIKPIRHPACVGKWFNAMDRRDVVALFPLDADNFDITPAIENKCDIDNETSNRHGIDGYLSDATVAKRIYDAVMMP